MRSGAISWGSGEYDAFKFSLTGTRTINVQSWEYYQAVDNDLNMRVQVTNASGTVLYTSSPSGNTRTNMTVTLGAGTYCPDIVAALGDMMQYPGAGTLVPAPGTVVLLQYRMQILVHLRDTTLDGHTGCFSHFNLQILKSDACYWDAAWFIRPRP